MCSFGECSDLCTTCHSWQQTGVVHLSLQADGNVGFEEIPVFSVYRQPTRILRCISKIKYTIITYTSVPVTFLHCSQCILIYMVYCYALSA